jgi:hypothetical protein
MIGILSPMLTMKFFMKNYMAEIKLCLVVFIVASLCVFKLCSAY